MPPSSVPISDDAESDEYHLSTTRKYGDYAPVTFGVSFHASGTERDHKTQSAWAWMEEQFTHEMARRNEERIDQESWDERKTGTRRY